MKIAIGSDHAGYTLKRKILQELEESFEVKDFGTHSTDSVDYPDFAHLVASAVEEGDSLFGILVCGSGNGVAMAANKHKSIRAALCWNTTLAQLAREHNNANILCLPARFVEENNAVEMVRLFLKTDFEGGRHTQRVNKI